MNAIEISHLTKIYKIFDRPIDRVKESLLPFHRRYSTAFYALRDVSFSIQKGETVGIIGKNGAGKSTLLKIITGVLTPTGGTVSVHGRIASLLELGAGFNPEMDGVENIYMNGTIMGISKEEMEARVPEIIAFADIGDFIHQPVKTYSSGMYARLAFAVNVFVEPDILIVDEALSVGDLEFQSKCYRKFAELRKRGITIIFVTHDINAVLNFCTAAVLMEHGSLVKSGTPKEVVNAYKKRLSLQVVEANRARAGAQPADAAGVPSAPGGRWCDKLHQNGARLEYGDKSIEIIDYAVFDEHGEISSQINNAFSVPIWLKVLVHRDVQHPIFAIAIKDIKGNELIGTNTSVMHIDTGTVHAGECYIIKFEQELHLRPDKYQLSLGCTEYVDSGLQVHHRLYDTAFLEIVSSNETVGIIDVQPEIEMELQP